MDAAVLHRTQARDALEHPAKMSLVVESSRQSDVCYATIGVRQQVGRANDPLPPHILSHGMPEVSSEAPGEMHRMDACITSVIAKMSCGQRRIVNLISDFD
jgi:hypothetical protein